MRDLIKTDKEIGREVINARELHRLLGVETRFADWIKRRLEKYTFLKKDRDYFCFLKYEKGDFNGYGNKTFTEYLLTLRAAQHISVMENTDIGYKLREDLFDIEENIRLAELQYKEQQARFRKSDKQTIIRLTRIIIHRRAGKKPVKKLTTEEKDMLLDIVDDYFTDESEVRRIEE